MKIEEKLHRKTNAISTGIAGTAGLVYLPEVIEESSIGKLDDIVVVILAAVAIAWYLFGGNRFKHSAIPGLLVAGIFCSKTLGAILEWGTAEVADNLVAVGALGVSLAFVAYLYMKKPSIASH